MGLNKRVDERNGRKEITNKMADQRELQHGRQTVKSGPRWQE